VLGGSLNLCNLRVPGRVGRVPSLFGSVEVCVGTRHDVIDLDGPADMPGRSQRGARDHELAWRERLRDREEFVSTHACHERAGAEGMHEVSRYRADRCVADAPRLRFLALTTFMCQAAARCQPRAARVCSSRSSSGDRHAHEQPPSASMPTIRGGGDSGVAPDEPSGWVHAGTLTVSNIDAIVDR
jgi:hypothetical protein